jgi:hypothetical protein
MAKLTTAQRKKIPQSKFALPGGRFPLTDKKHDKAAIMLSNKGTTPAEAALVRSKARTKLNNPLKGNK